MFSHSRFLRLPAALAALLAARVPSAACGPDFPNAYLTFNGERLTTLPTLSFAAELDRLLPGGARPAGGLARPTEADEVRAALRKTGVPADEAARLAGAVDRLRPPAKLPREFQLYADGARAWHAEQFAEAARAWRQLLELPAVERPYRTTWALYMIGRVEARSDPARAGASFRAVRQAATAGFADSEDLATASLGEEARLRLNEGDFAAALRLYFEQHAAGGASALPSLQFTLRELFRPLEPGSSAVDLTQAALRVIAHEPALRGVVTAWFAARGGPFAEWSPQASFQFRRWISFLPEVDTLTPAEADRWAWAAYQNGLWTEAAALAGKASPDAPASEWVRAMLRLRAGDLADAATHLAGASRGFPRDPALADQWFDGDTRFRNSREDPPGGTLAGVAGVLALQREQFTEALRLFVLAKHWADAAYVAERVLSLPELTAFVDAEPATGGEALRHLLARRLVRAGEFDRARDYFPVELRPAYAAYVADVRTGYREDLPARSRAAALWRAAEIARQHGMAIQGTELAPDFSIWSGNFEWPDLDAVRERFGGGDGLQPTAAESLRRAQHQVPGRRFHYRQRAAELALLAATLLPDNDEETARILHTAGRWLAPRNPDEAQYFYKLLVFRCPQTELGRAAAARHWFVEDAEKPIANPPPPA